MRVASESRVALRRTRRPMRPPRAATHSSWRSSFTLLSTSMILEPESSCMTRPEVMMGEMPSSMHVPRLLAMITRAQ